MGAGRHATVALAVTALGWSGQRAKRRTVSVAEERVFRQFNNADDHLHIPVWAVMQAGSLGAVYVTAAALEVRSRRRDAAAVALIGTAVWGGVKMVKPLVGRGRPEHHLDHVHVRGGRQSGLGYPSGHAAVSTTLALTALPSPAGWAVGLAAAAVTGGGRLYVGAHLPLDVVGGVAIGALAGLAADGIRRVCAG